jgi:hypothetical protein
MQVPSPSPIFVKPLGSHRLFLRFDNHEERVFDVTSYLDDSFFEPLSNPVVFDTVKTNGLTIEWMGGIDICPDELYENSKPL